MTRQQWRQSANFAPGPAAPPLRQARRPTLEAEALVPITHASAFAVGSSILVAVMFGGWLFGLDWWSWEAVRLLLFSSIVAGLVVFLIALYGGVAIRWAIWQAEVGLGLDLDRDGHLGQPPEPEMRRLVLEVQEGNKTHLVEIKSVPRDKMATVARGVLAGAPLTMNEWYKKRKVLTDPQVRALQAEMVDKGLVEWKNPAHHNQGARTTALGLAVLKSFATDG
jgi:hypothetical protein